MFGLLLWFFFRVWEWNCVGIVLLDVKVLVMCWVSVKLCLVNMLMV